MNKGFNISRFQQLKTLYLEEVKYSITNNSPKILIETQKNVIRILLRNISTRIISIISKEYHKGLNPEKILFIESSSQTDGFGIGDGIFKIPAIEATANYFNTKIDLICLENRKNIFEGNPYISEIITTQGNDSISQITSIIGKLIFKKYDLVISLNHGTKIGIIKLLTGIRTPFINEDIRNIDVNMNHTKKNIVALSKHIPDMLEYLNKLPKLYISEDEKNLTKEKLKHINGTKVAIFVGAINGLKDYKQWDEIIKGLNKFTTGLNFILLGSTKDKNTAEVLTSKFSNVYNFVGETNLKEAYAIINEMDLCIGSDGSLTNAAVALEKKLIVLFSIIEPEKIISDIANNVEKITGNCPNNTRCHQINVAKKCVITGQTNRNFSDTPPCIQNIDNEEIIIKSINMIKK
ncbi:MAG: glycosyltransferase family 9 protein [Candidatus Gracilibacteria bacterium]|nr:glycosyltransferase family 9 protein [Candidatus Gracilibacteria bacterium]